MANWVDVVKISDNMYSQTTETDILGSKPAFSAGTLRGSGLFTCVILYKINEEREGLNNLLKKAKSDKINQLKRAVSRDFLAFFYFMN